MWLSGRGRQAPEEEERDAQLGEVTVSGKETAVFLSGERRNIQPIAPGGYYWRPRERDTVLVVKTDTEVGGCLLGRTHTLPDWLPKGAVWISLDGENGVLLQGGGRIELTGQIYHNGVLVSAPPEEEEGGGGDDEGDAEGGAGT